VILTEVADLLATTQAPCEERIVRPTCQLPEGLFAAALLAHVSAEPLLVDYYYSRERDYVIAYWARRWPEHLSKDITLLGKEVQDLTRAGRDALRWFLGQPTEAEILASAVSALPSVTTDARLIILGAVGDVLSAGVSPERGAELLQGALRSLKDPEMSVRIAGAKLLTLVHQVDELETFFLENDREEVLLSLLQVDEEFPLARGSAGEIVLQVLGESAHRFDVPEGKLLESLKALIATSTTQVQIAAAKAMAFVDPYEGLSVPWPVLA
jgi:hypothetical protein